MIVLLIAGFAAGRVEEEQQVTSTSGFHNANRYEEAKNAIIKQRNSLPGKIVITKICQIPDPVNAGQYNKRLIKGK